MEIKDPIQFKKVLNKLPDDEIVEIYNEEKGKVTKLSIKDLKLLYNNNSFTVMGDGRLFRLDQEGIMPSFLKEFFQMKVSVNNEIIQIGKEKNKKENKNREKYFKDLLYKKDCEYKFTKLILNSVYGQLGNRYSRWSSKACATSVTTSGKFTIKFSEYEINDFFNKWSDEKIFTYWNRFLNEFDKKYNFYKSKDEFKKRLSFIENKDRVVFVDTDSNACVLEDIVEILFGTLNYDKEKYELNVIDDDKLIEYILILCKYIQEYLNDQLENELKRKIYNSNVNFKIEQKQEIVAKKAIILGKKKYALWVVNKKGVPKDNLSVTGIELIKSDTAKCVKKPLETILEIILKSNDLKRDGEKIKKIINETKKKIKNEDFIDIGTGVNLNNLNKYNEKRNFRLFEIPKGCPIHVRAALHYNDLIKHCNINYEEITEGNKIFYIPVKPKSLIAIKNKILDLAFIEDFPNEFFEHIEVDYKRLIDKIFIDKLKIITDRIGLEFLLNRKKELIKNLFGK